MSSASFSFAANSQKSQAYFPHFAVKVRPIFSPFFSRKSIFYPTAVRKAKARYNWL